jgi:hypothetical protein
MKKITIFFLIFASTLISQLPIPDDLGTSSTTFSQDTVCIKYNFLPGDSIYYRVEAYDSIVTNYDEPLLRHRFERHLIVCDSINSMGRYHLQHTMVNYIARESKGEIQNIERLDAPWVGTTVYYEIDESGRRFSYSVGDSTVASVAPGGAFTPYLFFDLASYCNVTGRNWVDSKTIEIPENGVPFPLYKHTTLFRMQELIDTLDEKCARVEFTRTGNGSYKVPMSEKMVRVTNKTNGFGLLDISLEKQIPIHFYMTNEQKLSIKKANGDSVPGKHHTTAYFTLEEYLPAPREDEKEE